MNAETVAVCRGVRGAITADTNSSEDILLHTRRLMAVMIRTNGIKPEDIAFALFSTTRDLDADFPAFAARQFGWFDVPLICTNEIPVPGALPKCIRILMNWNTIKSQQEIRHIYLRDAVTLRPDISHLPPVDWDELEDWIESYLQSDNPT
jgi:chorismate mutase